jgi:hypothetical protein
MQPASRNQMQKLKLRTRKSMAKKAAKKASKKKQPRDGNDPNALGLEGPGVSVKRIPAITKAVNEYLEIKDARCLLTPKEVKAKEKVVTLMKSHENDLRDPRTGNLVYPLDDDRYIEIEPAKVTIKVREQKPAKPTKQKAEEPGPEGQMSDDQQD